VVGTVAIVALLLLHVPPTIALASRVWLPAHTVSVPVIAAGIAFTVIGSNALQPVGITYDIVTAAAATPVTMPVALTVAFVVLLLIQLPPVVVVLNAVVAPTHTIGVPVIAAGVALTVTTLVVMHALLPRYVIVAVPAAMPVTVALVSGTVAILVLLLLHVPPPVADGSVVVAPSHTMPVPIIADGKALTVNASIL
jgi:hypothetical protein